MNNIKDLKSNYKTTQHFKDRLLERFGVFNNHLQWAQTFFNGEPRLVSDNDNVQKWSNGSIVVVANVVEHSYITAYPIGSNVFLDSDTFHKFKDVADKTIIDKKRKSIRKIAEIKKQLLTQVSNPDASILQLNKVNQEIENELINLNTQVDNINSFLEIVVIDDEKK